MTKLLYPVVLCIGISVPYFAVAETPRQSAMILAQAHDRCMTTYAVRESKTDASDENIFLLATEGCQNLEEELHAAIRNEYPADQADQLIPMLKNQAQPNFYKMLGKIRADRQRRTEN